MKKLLLPILFLLTASIAFSAPFLPEKLVLSAPSAIKYDFDSSVLHIPLTVSGHSSNTIFLVYTKDKGNDIGTFRNGYLGWHYVNRLDTCVYLRQDGLHEIGVGEILWDGKDTYGAKVPADTYTYYLWGYDNQSPKIPAMICLGNWGYEAQLLHVEDTDASGNKLTNPNIYGGVESNYAAIATKNLTIYKWRVGADPTTARTDLEWTTTGRGDINRVGGSMTLDPYDHSMVYSGEMGADYRTYVTKYKWVPGGASTLQIDWGVDGTYHWTSEKVPGWCQTTGVNSDGADLLFFSYFNQIDPIPFSQQLFVDRETGDKVKTVEQSQWYCSKADADAGGQMNGGPERADFNVSNGLLTTASTYCCGTLAIDPYRADGDEIVWTNFNGDYVHDKDFQPDATRKWACNDFSGPPWCEIWTTDPYGFSAFSASGLADFGLIGPSGQGIGYFMIASPDGYGCSMPVKVGSAYDGCYTNGSKDAGGIGWLGYDALKGVITNVTGVADAAPSAFLVAQNTPNPFNPSTTISFTLAKAGKVTVDIFNISGQKVNTLVNTTMNAGAHSVTWNASKHSAGVYFYTVKSENYSKTMKMTLLK